MIRSYSKLGMNLVNEFDEILTNSLAILKINGEQILKIKDDGELM